MFFNRKFFYINLRSSNETPRARVVQYLDTLGQWAMGNGYIGTTQFCEQDSFEAMRILENSNRAHRNQGSLVAFEQLNSIERAVNLNSSDLDSTRDDATLQSIVNLNSQTVGVRMHTLVAMLRLIEFEHRSRLRIRKTNRHTTEMRRRMNTEFAWNRAVRGRSLLINRAIKICENRIQCSKSLSHFGCSQ